MKLLNLTALILTLGLSFSANAGFIQIDEVKTEASYVRHYFGHVPVNSMNRARYTIRNTGFKDLRFEGAWVRGPFFNFYHSCPNILKSQAICHVEISYWPAFEGFHYGNLDMLFSDKSDIYFDLSGQSVRW